MADRKQLKILMDTFGLKEDQGRTEFVKEMRIFRDSMGDEELEEFLDECEAHLEAVG